MISRLMIATLVVLTTLTGVAYNAAPIQDSRRVLLVFKQQNCPPCVGWYNAYNSPHDARLRISINQRFRMKAFFDYQFPDLVQKYSVDRFPTFIVLDSNCEQLDRVEGFPGPEALFHQLTDNRGPARPELRAPTPAPSTRDNAARQRLQAIESANANLIEERDALRDRIDRLQRQQFEQRDANTEAAEKLAANHQLQLDQLKAQLQELQTNPPVAESPQPAERSRPPNHSGSGRETQTDGASMGEEIESDWFTEVLEERPNISAEIVEPDQPGTLEKWIGVVGWFASTGAKLAGPEVSVPLTIAGTMIGFGVRSWRKRKQKGSATTPTNFPGDANMPLPRNLDEARELLRLRQKEGRHAIHDGLYGALADAELEKLIESGDATALKLRDTLQQRLNQIAPLSTKPNEEL